MDVNAHPTLRCPYCKVHLQPLFYTTGGADNLYRCWRCKPGLNRFIDTGAYGLMTPKQYEEELNTYRDLVTSFYEFGCLEPHAYAGWECRYCHERADRDTKVIIHDSSCMYNLAEAVLGD